MNYPMVNKPKKLLEERYLGSILAEAESFQNVREVRVNKLVGWKPARPVKYHNLKNRLFQAWDVFNGRADALYWYEDFQD